MITKYQNGYRLEREIKLALEAKGFYVIRSAGSKGKADLIAFQKQAEKGIAYPMIYPIQLKKSGLSDNAKVKLIKELIECLKPGYYQLSPKVLSGSLSTMKEEIEGW